MQFRVVCYDAHMGNSRSFAAIRRDGSLVTWGDRKYGGDSSAVASQLRSGVMHVYGNAYVCVALRHNPSLVV